MSDDKRMYKTPIDQSAPAASGRAAEDAAGEEAGWLGELLTSYYNADGPVDEFDDAAEAELDQGPIPERWSDAAIAAEYVVAMQDIISRRMETLVQTPFTRLLRYLFADAGITDPGPVWRWLGLNAEAPLDVSTAREFGKLGAALHVPLELMLASVQCELAEKWEIRTPAGVHAAVWQRHVAGEEFDSDSGESPAARAMPLELAANIKPFQLMDLRLIVAEVRAAYGDFE